MTPLTAAAKKKAYSVKLDPALIAALRAIKVRDGIGESEQIRRGIRLWLKQKGVEAKSDRKRAATRKRP